MAGASELPGGSRTESLDRAGRSGRAALKFPVSSAPAWAGGERDFRCGASIFLTPLVRDFGCGSGAGEGGPAAFIRRSRG